METIVVIMLKNKKTGFLEKEITSISILNNEDLLLNINATQNESNIDINLKITTSDVSDWEYDAIYDNYDTSVFENIAKEIKEIEGEYNPTWELTISYDNNDQTLKNNIAKILELHSKELESTYEKIKHKKGEYDYE